MTTKEEQKTYLMLLDMDKSISNEKINQLTKKAKLQLALMKFYSDGFTEYEEKNDGWFYRSFELLKEATGIGSNHTIIANIKLFESLGLLEKKQEYITRNGKTAKVNYYRFADKKNCTDNKTALTEMENCTDKTALTNDLNNSGLFQNCTDINPKTAPTRIQNCTDIKCTNIKNQNCTDITIMNTNELHQNCTDIKKQNCTIEKDIEKDIVKESLIVDSLIDWKTETPIQVEEGNLAKKFYEFEAVENLKTFILQFLSAETREEGKALYREYTEKHTLQDEDMEFLTAYTSKVAELKGWKKQQSSTLRTPSEIAFLDVFEDELEETPTVKNKAKNTASSSVEGNDTEVQLNKAIEDFKAFRKDSFNRWYKVLELQGEATADKNMEAFVLGGAVEDRFNKFELYKKGIVQQQKAEVIEGWLRYKDSIRRKNEEKVKKQFFKAVEEIAKAYRWCKLDATNKEKVFYTEIQPLVLNKYYSTCTREVQQTKANDAVQLMDKMAS